MNRKEIEQEVSLCYARISEKLLADKEFLNFLHYFPAGIGDEVKRYFNQVATGTRNFFMVPDREDKQKAVCSRCGKDIVLAANLAHKDKATCPKCRAKGEVVHGWRKPEIEEKHYFTYFERALYDKEAIIARSFAVYRYICADTGEVVDDYVPREYYLMRRNEVSHWSRSADGFGYEWWDKRRSLYSRNYIMVLSGYIVWSGLDRLMPLLTDSWLKYSQLYAYIRLTHFGEDAFKYIEFYQKHPQLEYVMKMGLWNIVVEGLGARSSFRNLFNWRGKNPKELLRVPIGKGDMLALSALAVDIDTLNLALYIKRNSRYSLTELANKRKELERLSDSEMCRRLNVLREFGVGVEEAFRYMHQQQKKNPYSSGRNIFIDWIDYLQDCCKLGLNLEDTAVLKPHDLQQAHQNVITQLKIKADEELDKQIAQLKEERKQYNFTAGGFVARAAESSSELIAEGKILHHCVGTYADRHAKGKCTIILIRRLEEPEVPFYTMELVGPEKRIIQVRGSHNCGMTQEVEAFVESYKKYLAELGKKKGAKAA